MKSSLEIILSPYCAGILNEKDYQFIIVKKGRTEEDASLQLAATSTEGLKKQNEHLQTIIDSDQTITDKDRAELELILAWIGHEIARRS